VLSCQCTGHSQCEVSLHAWSVWDDPNCECCMSNEPHHQLMMLTHKIPTLVCRVYVLLN